MVMVGLLGASFVAYGAVCALEDYIAAIRAASKERE